MTNAIETSTNTVARMSTKSILSTFDALIGRRDAETAIVRGWLMDELEARNISAFDRWLDSTEESPSRFFEAA